MGRAPRPHPVDGSGRPVGPAVEDQNPFLNLGKPVDGHVQEFFGRLWVVRGKGVDKIDMAAEKPEIEMVVAHGSGIAFSACPIMRFPVDAQVHEGGAPEQRSLCAPH